MLAWSCSDPVWAELRAARVRLKQTEVKLSPGWLPGANTVIIPGLTCTFCITGDVRLRPPTPVTAPLNTERSLGWGGHISLP